MWDILGIDWGLKFFGIAKASSINSLVIPYNQPVSNDNIETVLEKILQTDKIVKVVIGKPTNLSLQKIELDNQIQDFIDKLAIKYPELEIISRYERGTSKQVVGKNQHKKLFLNSDLSHHEVAMILLKEYLKIS